jgi:Flp pilus assembly protein TadD
MKTAMSIWSDILRKEPNRKQIRVTLANAQWASGDYEGARTNYAQVLSVDPSNAEALNGMGLYHLRQSKLGQAEQEFRGSLQSNPKFVPAYNNLAITLERLNKRKQAIQLLERAVRLDPNNKDARGNLERMRAAG